MVAALLRTDWTLAQDILMLEVEGPGFVLNSPDRSINNDNLERERMVERILTRGWFEWRAKYCLKMSDGDRAGDMDQLMVLLNTWGM